MKCFAQLFGSQFARSDVGPHACSLALVVLAKQRSPGFVAQRRRGPAFRFKMPIHVIDASTLELVANSMDWAQHRRRKAAAKTHLRLNLQSLLPGFVVVDTAGEHDNLRARELCAGIKSGEIALFGRNRVGDNQLRDPKGIRVPATSVQRELRCGD
jgi:hypothetical protein